MVDYSWSDRPPPAPRPSNLTTPSSGDAAPVQTDNPPAAEEILVSNPAEPTTIPNGTDNEPPPTYPFANVSRVASPEPRGFYDPDDYHRLQDHQIRALLERRPNPARFDRYAFSSQQFGDFYQGVVSDFANLSNHFPADGDRERDARVAYIRSVTRRFHSMIRVVRP